VIWNERKENKKTPPLFFSVDYKNLVGVTIGSGGIEKKLVYTISRKVGKMGLSR
jgi:hypothetical protein